ncbi:hypothetical protein BHM03_00037057 [Ensete ventricosum]|nr:hypothetical protein BHM03_00037057 [Ensete ventricosum]
MPQCCHSSCQKQVVHNKIVLIGDRGPGSKQWCTNSSEFVAMQYRQSCPVRDKIMRRYDQELLGAPLWCMIGAAGELDCFSAHIRLREPGKSEDKADPATRWWRPCMRVAVCLSIDQGELLGGHSGVEAGGRKGRGSDDESSGAQLPKSKASVRKEVDSEEHHSATEADLPIAKEGMQMQVNG